MLCRSLQQLRPLSNNLANTRSAVMLAKNVVHQPQLCTSYLPKPMLPAIVGTGGELPCRSIGELPCRSNIGELPAEEANYPLKDDFSNLWEGRDEDDGTFGEEIECGQHYYRKWIAQRKALIGLQKLRKVDCGPKKMHWAWWRDKQIERKKKKKCI